jgi:hypothetical protein
MFSREVSAVPLEIVLPALIAITNRFAAGNRLAT